ncbi:MAG: RNA methyltransferase [Thermoproteales archaeon]|nr:RNA methyltransferase [Thermoproteales archaeon]
MSNVIVVLMHPLYEQNVGLIARVMKNFEASELRLVDPACEVGDEAYRRAMHGRDILEKAKTYDTLEEAIRDCDLIVGTTGKHGKRFSHVRRYMNPEQLASKIAVARGNVAILFGREDFGLTNEELRKCNAVVTIPANKEYPILNVSHAVAIILYEIFKKKKAPSVPEIFQPVDLREEKVMLQYLTMLARKVEPEKADKIELIMKRFLASCQPTGADIRTLIGIFRKTLELLENKRYKRAKGK